MKNLKLFSILLLSVLLLLICSDNKLYADDFYGFTPDLSDYTINLSQNTQLNLSVSKDWKVKTDSDGNTLFIFTKGTSPIVITIFKNVFPYKTAEEMKKFIGMHKKQAVKTIPNKGKIKEGYDHLKELSIPWLMILEETELSNSKMFHKISYPYNKEKVFTVVTSISGKPEYMKEVEYLLNSIIVSILNLTKDPKNSEIKKQPPTKTEIDTYIDTQSKPNIP